MKKTMKRTLALLLAVLMLCSGATAAFAAPRIEQTDKTQYGTENALGRIVQNLTETEGDDKQYAISALESDGAKVTAAVSNAGACTLVVALYDEMSAQMLGAGVAQIEADCGHADVTLDVDAMPAYYVLKAFLLDEDHRALCKSYESREHTQAFEEFLSKAPEDFADETVLLFDEEKEVEDFAVLTDDVLAGTYSAAMTYTYDEVTDSYTFRNATPQVKALQPGEMFYYAGEDGDYLLFKVKSITVTGSTVVIVQDADVSVDELFSFIRIDEAEGDYDRMEPLRQEDLGEALLLDDSVQAQAEIDESGSHEWSTTLKLKFPQTDLPEGDKPPVFQFKAEGSLKLSFKTSMSLYYDVVLFGKDYFELKHEFSFTLELSGKVTAGFDLTPYLTIPIPDIPIGATGFTLKFEPAIAFKGNIAVSFSLIKYTYTKTTTADSENGLHAAEEKSHDFDGLYLDDKFEVSLGIQLSVKLSFLKSLSLKLTGEVGLQIVGDKAPVGIVVDAIRTDELHDCTFCIDGDLNFYVEVGLTFGFKLLALKWEWEIVKYRYEKKLLDFYISWPLGFGKGLCPNRYHALNIEVMEKGKARKDATVACATGKCDADGDGKYNETSMTTGKDGMAKFYCKPGTHTVTVSAGSYAPKTETVKMLEVEKTVTVTFGSDPGPDDPDNPDGPSDLSGYSVGDTFTFGSYPQSRVTDSATLTALNAAPKTWQSYGYYSGTGDSADGGMVSSDYMQYADVQMGGKYRAVKFTHYRPYATGATSSAENSYQDNNGYAPDTVYWFQYEPLVWRVLDPAAGLVLCETIIDSQPYNNYAIRGNGEYWGNAEMTIYASNYANSSIHSWLNEDFYNTAFTDKQKQKILSPTIQNPSTFDSRYDSADTRDPVFLLSRNDVKNADYKLNMDAARQAKGSDYAKCQGLWVDSPNKCSDWWLRTAYSSYYVYYVYNDGSSSHNRYPNRTYFGVRPALQLNPGSGISKSPKKPAVQRTAQAGETLIVQQGETYTAAQSGAVAGQEYVLLVREAGAADIAAETLWYIDQQTAAGDTVTFTYVPRCSGECSVQIIGSDAAACTVTLDAYTPPLDEEDEEEYTDRGYALEGGTVTGGGAYAEGDEVTLTAVPNAYYKFIGWYDGDTLVNASATYSFTVTADVSLTAKFLKNGDVNGDGYVDAGDATLILRHVVAGTPEQDPLMRQPWQLAVGDVNGSYDPSDPDCPLEDEVDAGDATLILRFLVDPDKTLPC